MSYLLNQASVKNETGSQLSTSHFFTVAPHSDDKKGQQRDWGALAPIQVSLRATPPRLPIWASIDFLTPWFSMRGVSCSMPDDSRFSFWGGGGDEALFKGLWFPKRDFRFREQVYWRPNEFYAVRRSLGEYPFETRSPVGNFINYGELILNSFLALILAKWLALLNMFYGSHNFTID